MPQLLYDKSGTMSVFRRSETLVVVKLAVSWELELHFLCGIRRERGLKHKRK